MYAPTEYEMTETQLSAILHACRPTRVMMVGGFVPASPQENANRAWAELGKEMGFDPMTVRPSAGKGERFFMAVPSETEQSRGERQAREAEQHRQTEIARLTKEIAERESQLAAIKG